MRKVVISQLGTYSLIGLISCANLVGTSFYDLTQAKENSVTETQRHLSTSLIWPTQGNISRGFNPYHEGIDIAGSSGTPIVAAASGKAIEAGWDNSGWGLGNKIEIQHPDGSRTVYAHNSRLLVSKGQQVTQGQVIAEMGSTGNSTGPHLHFEIHTDGRLAVDPFALLPPLVAGKIPSLQSIEVASAPDAAIAVMSDSQCGDALIEGETAESRVKVCRVNGQLFYQVRWKRKRLANIQMLAKRVGQDRYRATRGSDSYYVSRDGVEVWRNGRQIRFEPFLRL
ncbi:MAG TPA: M23 family metallopeptidase [Candidatus Obscuribacterales bacterium]